MNKSSNKENKNKNTEGIKKQQNTPQIQKPSKLVFNPIIEEKEIKIPNKLVKINLPGIATTIEHISNHNPSLVSESAVGMTFTHQQQTIFSIEYIDIDRISDKKSSPKKNKGTKAPFDLNELKTIARNINIKGASSMNKKELAIAVRTKILQLKSKSETE